MSLHVRRIMIVGGNFSGRGAEAMMLVVRDALSAAYSPLDLFVPVRTETQNAQYRASGFQPVKVRHLHRPLRMLHDFTHSRGWCCKKPPKQERAMTRGLLNPYRLTSAVVDISGFATGDQWGTGAALRRWQAGVEMKQAGNKVVYMPQSWGPFSDSLLAEYTRRLCNDADLVFAREQSSYDSLMNLKGIHDENICLAPDIAFQFRPASLERAVEILDQKGLQRDAAPTVCVTPNIRIYERVEGRGIENAYVAILQRIVGWFQNTLDAQIVLIPHETWRDRPDDSLLCNLIAERAPHPQRVCEFSGQEKAAEIKAVISQSDFLVASRYHSLVAAFSTATPVAVIGWSHKYDYLMAAAKLENWCADLTRRTSEDIVAMTQDAWERRAEIASSFKEALPELEQKSRRCLQMMIEQVG